MVVVFLDGVDGAGKTTLLRRLTEHPRDHRPVVAPPLWRYLASVTSPEAFAEWATTTEPARVAVELLCAQRDRTAAIRRTLRDVKQPTILVDRGPRTVEASARAHQRARLTPNHADREVEGSVASLRDAVGQLAGAGPCLSIVLDVHSYEQVIDRLTVQERQNPAYVRYLQRLLQEFRAGQDVEGVTPLVLSATDTVARNQAAATRAIGEFHAATRRLAHP